ncbi:MAG: hypothetical protein B7W98_01300, partial [Parcubacteria group bacterium 20-58-5]
MIRRTLSIAILLAFVSLALFSFTAMKYGPDGRMQGDCPFSALGASLCQQGGEAGVLHHIAAYQSFLNIPAGSDLTAAIIASLLAFAAALAFSIRTLSVRPPTPIRRFYHSPPVSFRTRKITRWLSLFENSP